MKNKKIFLSIFVLFSFLFNFLIGAVRAATLTDTVEATVTAQNISVSVDNLSIAFGTIGVGSSANTTTGAGGVNDSSIATNDGNITEKFNIKAGDSTNWALDTTAASEKYTMKSCVTNCDSSPAWTSVGIEPAYATLVASIGIGGTQPFDLEVGTPTSTASYGEQTITVTVQATTPD